MLNEAYPAIYRDQRGEISTTIYNDGENLRMNLRGIEFVGIAPDDFEQDMQENAPELHQFVIDSFGSLRDFVLDWNMPIPVIIQGNRSSGLLQEHFEIGRTLPNGMAEQVFLHLTHQVAGQIFLSKGKSGDFGIELTDIHRQLPADTRMEICYFCAFSGYSPIGAGDFGCLDCFRHAKQEYLAVKTKRELSALYAKKIVEPVQEIYRCAEFKRRIHREGPPYGQC